MKNKEKVLMLLGALGLLIVPGLAIGAGLFYLTGLPWWGTALVISGSQVLFHLWATKVKEVQLIHQAVDKYESLQYKKYLVPLVCQACGEMNHIELDLTITEFECEHCEKDNAVYLDFSTAVKSEVIYDPKDFLANASGVSHHGP